MAKRNSGKQKRSIGYVYLATVLLVIWVCVVGASTLSQIKELAEPVWLMWLVGVVFCVATIYGGFFVLTYLPKILLKSK